MIIYSTSSNNSIVGEYCNDQAMDIIEYWESVVFLDQSHVLDNETQSSFYTIAIFKLITRSGYNMSVASC